MARHRCPGNPILKIDLRLLDRVELLPETDDSDDSDDAEAEPSDLREHDSSCEVLLACNDFEVALHVADGPEAAQRIVAEAAPWTRDNGGAERPVPTATHADRASPRTSHGMFVVLSSTSDAEIRADDGLAGRTYELTKPVMLVGRASGNDIVIDHRSISREHAKVTSDPDTGHCTITDLDADNGVRVNGSRAPESSSTMAMSWISATSACASWHPGRNQSTIGPHHLSPT